MLSYPLGLELLFIVGLEGLGEVLQVFWFGVLDQEKSSTNRANLMELDLCLKWPGMLPVGWYQATTASLGMRKSLATLPAWGNPYMPFFTCAAYTCPSMTVNTKVGFSGIVSDWGLWHANAASRWLWFHPVRLLRDHSSRCGRRGLDWEWESWQGISFGGIDWNSEIVLQ
jgi:hypothetical protein